MPPAQLRRGEHQHGSHIAQRLDHTRPTLGDQHHAVTLGPPFEGVARFDPIYGRARIHDGDVQVGHNVRDALRFGPSLEFIGVHHIPADIERARCGISDLGRDPCRLNPKLLGLRFLLGFHLIVGQSTSLVDGLLKARHD